VTTLLSADGRRAANPEGASRKTLHGVLADLYADELGNEDAVDRAYLGIHAIPEFIRDQVRTFEWYRRHLPRSGRVLDWGCRHAPDSCLLRTTFGERLRLFGCDFQEPMLYPAFHSYSRLDYTQVSHPLELPYEDNSFDVVIGAGVLEHTALDYDSLRQLYRVLKPDGKLIVYYLPNYWSIQEWYRRTVRKEAFHRRLYRLPTVLETIKHFGFYPLEGGYHDTGFWERKLGLLGSEPLARRAGGALQRAFPLRLLRTTIRFVATKVTAM
jgi:SAM-dependent methyltransferase